MNKDTSSPEVEVLHRHAEVFMDSLVRQVNEARRSKGLSIPAFARAAGQPASSARRKLADRGVVYIRDLFTWARAFGPTDEEGWETVLEWVRVAQGEADEAVPRTWRDAA
jgi:hypothetical protein